MRKVKFWSLPFLMLSAQVQADYREDIAYYSLKAELGETVPGGSSIKVTQVEAAIGASETEVGAWMPNAAHIQFDGKMITDRSLPVSDGISSHATSVGLLFYGNNNSMTPKIGEIDIYSATDWLGSGFLNAGTSRVPLVSESAIVNHSWVGNLENPRDTVSVLHRVDWLTQKDDLIQVVGVNNGSIQKELLSNAFNVIAVGRTDGNHAQGTAALDSVYAAGRSGADVVVPLGTTSSATAVVSSAAARLVEQAQTLTQGGASGIGNGERSELVKAILMAGADRETQNVGTTHQITDYRMDASKQTDNGLDVRYGAGQINVYNNYQIMAGGQQDSLQDGNGEIDWLGWDYDANFGGAQGSNHTASYFFATTESDGMQLNASLVWNIEIEDAPGPGFNPSARLHNMDLFLYDVTGGNESLFVSSTNTVDNSENLWLFLEAGRDYELRVVAMDSTPFNSDYALAWRVSSFAPVPIPAAFWFLLTGLFGIVRFKFQSESESNLM